MNIKLTSVMLGLVIAILIWRFAGALNARPKNHTRTGKERAMNKVIKTDAEWKSILTEEQYRIARRKGTEQPFCHPMHDNKKEGVYACVGCGLPLFGSDGKFTSGTGWPSFFKPLAQDRVATEQDNALGMVRTEILCSRCDTHLGHVFNDGPQPTGLRFCVNGEALVFHECTMKNGVPVEPLREKATFAAGCFWGVEHTFMGVDGVVTTMVGYTGGSLDNPTYKQVCHGNTGHAEAVELEYDPAKVSYHQLLTTFWSLHDPTTLNRQGPDIGTQYRSAVFYHNERQRVEAEAMKARLQKDDEYYNGRKIASQILPAETFWCAEEYHQQYHKKSGRPTCGTPGKK